MVFLKRVLINLLVFLLLGNFAFADLSPEPDNPDLSPEPTPIDISQIIPINSSAISYSSPAVAELDGDISNGKEIVVASSDSKVHAYHSNGSILWSHTLPNSNCSATSNSNKIFSSPAIGNLYNDGIPYVVIGYGGIGGATCGGGVVAINGLTGQKKWHFNLKKFMARKRIWAMLYAVFGTPSLADVNGDGLLEIGFGSHDRGIYLLSHTGKLIWRLVAADTVWSSPAFADTDGDGLLEMIIGTDITGNQHLVPPTQDGGILYAIKTNDVKDNKRRYRAKLYNFRDSRIVKWMKEFDQTIMSSPSIGELIPNNPGLEVVIGSGCYFPEGTNNKRGRWFKILSLSSGEVLNTLNITACSSSTAAIGDLDDDGKNEIAVSVNGNSGVGGDGFGRLMAFNPNESEPFWSVIPEDRSGNYNLAGNYLSPIIADVDGNGSLEVLLGNSRSVHVFAGSNGEALSCQGDNCNDLPSFRTGNIVQSTPNVSDLNYDGIPEMVIGSANNGYGAIYIWSNLVGKIVSDAGTQEVFASPWNSYKGNDFRSGINNSTSF